MKPEHTKPFNAEHAKAGAPYCCRNGDSARVLIWDRRANYHLGGIRGDQDELCSWTQDGQYLRTTSGSEDLVMLPLGLCEGKPVFVGDELVWKNHQVVIAEPNSTEFLNCSWTKPRQYPETKLRKDQLVELYSTGLYSTADSCKSLANAVLKHAINTGQVWTEARVREALRLAGVEVEVWMNTPNDR